MILPHIPQLGQKERQVSLNFIELLRIPVDLDF